MNEDDRPQSDVDPGPVQESDAERVKGPGETTDTGSPQDTGDTSDAAEGLDEDPAFNPETSDSGT
jgi:hypothetical protein